MHTDIGYNYRMTNVQAAIGCAQLGKIENIISSKRKIAAFYTNGLSSSAALQLPVEKTYARNVYWMYHINLLGPVATKREFIMEKLLEWGIETREGFVPYNMQEIFINRGWVNLEDCPRANRVALSSFYLPSGPLLAEEELEYVVGKLKLVLNLTGT